MYLLKTVEAFVHISPRSRRTRTWQSLEKGLRALTAACLALSVSLGTVAQPTPAFAAGTTYYVSTTTGNDSNNGLSSGAAKRTIAAAVTAASASDIIRVIAGTYYDRVVVNKALTIMADSGSKPVVKQGFVITAAATIDGIEVDPRFWNHRHSRLYLRRGDRHTLQQRHREELLRPPHGR